MQQYKSINGQSIQDVCLSTYGSLDYIYKLIQDSGVESIEYVPKSGDVFLYDLSLTVNNNINRTRYGYIAYATSALI
jgi:hypothetical protein